MIYLSDGVPIAVVEQETGLSKDVLRKWEVRYNFPIPERDSHGDRIYSREQIARLQTIKRLMDRGFRPSRLFGLEPEELEEMSRASPAINRSSDGHSAVPELMDLITKHQPMKLRAMLKRLLQSQGLELFVQDTIAPLSAAVGEAWSRGEIRIFEEHLYSEIAASTLRQALDSLDSMDGQPRILLTSFPGEPHSLGLLMAACLFTLHGAHCIYLGTEMPGGEIAQAAGAHAVDAVALSFSSAFPTRQIQPTLIDLRKRMDQGVGVIAGGAGVKRQKPVEGVVFIDNLGDIKKFVATYRRQ